MCIRDRRLMVHRFVHIYMYASVFLATRWSMAMSSTLQRLHVGQRVEGVIAEDRRRSAPTGHHCQAPPAGPDWTACTDASHGIPQTFLQARSEFAVPMALQAHTIRQDERRGYVRHQPRYAPAYPATRLSNVSVTAQQFAIAVPTALLHTGRAAVATPA